MSPCISLSSTTDISDVLVLAHGAALLCDHNWCMW